MNSLMPGVKARCGAWSNAPTGRRSPAPFQTPVVYAIALRDGRKLTPENMFTFTQVALYRAVKTLRNEKVAVEVIAIPS